jgi:hypothetical protein
MPLRFNKKWASALIFIISLPFTILGVIFLRSTTKLPPGYEQDVALFLIVGIVSFSLGIFLWGVSKRVKAISATAVLQIDKRPPVLYLRSFRDEKKSSLRQNSAVLQYITLMGSVLPQNLNTEEEQLAILLKNIGPAICLGKPGDLLPRPGIHREYVPSESWQQKVIEFISTAQLVIIRANETEGLRWEIDFLWKHAKRTKLIFLLPDKQKNADSFNRLLSTIIGKPVPAYKVEWLTENFSGILYFDEEENPQFVPIKKQFFRFGNLVSIRLKKTLQSLPGHIIHFESFRPAPKKERLHAFLIDALAIAGIALIPGVIVAYNK